MNPFARISRHRRGCVDDGGSTAGAERRHNQSSAQEEESNRVSQLQGSLSGGACWQGSPKIVANRLGDFCEEAGILPEEQCGFRYQRSTTDLMFVVHRLQELGRTSNTPLAIFFINLPEAYDAVDRVLLWEVLARLRVLARMMKAIHILHDGMRARVELDNGDFSAWFNACQGLRQGCVLSPLLFNILFAAFIIVVLQRFAEDPLIVSDLVYLDSAPKSEDGRSREEETLEMVRGSGVGGAVCRRCGGVDIASWLYPDDERYNCRISGIRTDSVGEENQGHAPVARSQHSVKRTKN